ncbi:hypothetical protein ACFSKL_05610 [Belliella marina]|uniref:Lipocalin-like domain-containing protein n=1 Tax=Belliella marina TaxID=1644146 RepID=A0ABW4VLU8_9BACT
MKNKMQTLEGFADEKIVMKKKRLFLSILIGCITSIVFAQDLKRQLLGKWKLTKNEAYEFSILHSIPNHTDEAALVDIMAWMDDVHENTYMDFFSPDSLRSTLIDKKEIIQYADVWNVSDQDSIITWKTKFPPHVLQAKVIKVNDEILELKFLKNQKVGRYSTHFKKLRSETDKKSL